MAGISGIVSHYLDFININEDKKNFKKTKLVQYRTLSNKTMYRGKKTTGA